MYMYFSISSKKVSLTNYNDATIDLNSSALAFAAFNKSDPSETFSLNPVSLINSSTCFLSKELKNTDRSNCAK